MDYSLTLDLVMPAVNNQHTQIGHHIDRVKLDCAYHQWVQAPCRWWSILGPECCNLWLRLARRLYSHNFSSFLSACWNKVRDPSARRWYEPILHSECYLCSRYQGNQEEACATWTSNQSIDCRRQGKWQSEKNPMYRWFSAGLNESSRFDYFPPLWKRQPPEWCAPKVLLANQKFSEMLSWTILEGPESMKWSCGMRLSQIGKVNDQSFKTQSVSQRAPTVERYLELA